ncbi:integrase catalytic domain-containing protein [Trichonephila clavipes]|nr:integrase catalytic domain-containing protein [Trichonephila clavipes]
MLCFVTLTPKILLPWYARKFSKFHSILRLVAWVLRFLNNVKSRISNRKKRQLSLDELESAEIQLIRSVQAQSFTDEKLISNLSVFRDNNIIRVKTRITERIDESNFLSPILLPNNCIFTQRLVEHFHLKNYHAGTQLLLCIIREKYWIIGGRRTVRKIWKACVKCRRFKSKSPMTDPISLPSDRVKNAAVFEVVDVDLAGPLYVKRGDKVWIVFYTCAIYRALHLELVSSLSADAFLLPFRRFVARRGRPRIIYSDKGTNFRGAYNKLVDIDWNEVSRYAEIQRIAWKFIPPTAAWWGGFWERLVRTGKELLRRTLGKAIFTYEELLTILCECEKVVNSRPLTYLSEDMQDLTPITPARFLFEIPTADTKDLDVRDANHSRKRLRFRAKVIKELKRRFRNEYLGQLIQRQIQHPQSSNIQVGDIVLIGDDWKKRLQWSLARVIKLIPGKDGLVQQTDSSVSCPNPDTLKATEQPQVTRCGRPVKKPDKLNLLILTDVFD